MHPEAEVMQGHPGRQARRPPTERMRPVPIEAKGGRAFLLDRLHHLADTREPAPPWRGPRPLARALGRAEHVGTGGRPPRPLVGLALTALVDAIRTPRGSPATGQARRGKAAPGHTRLRPRLLLGAGGPTPQAGDHPDRGDGPQEGAPCIPAQPVPPAHVGQPRQPPCPPALGLPRGEARAVEGFRGTGLGRQEVDESQKKRDHRRGLLAALPMVLLPGGPRRQGGPEMTRGLTVQAPRTAQALPLPAQGQGDPLTPAEGRLGGPGGAPRLCLSGGDARPPRLTAAASAAPTGGPAQPRPADAPAGQPARARGVLPVVPSRRGSTVSPWRWPCWTTTTSGGWPWRSLSGAQPTNPLPTPATGCQPCREWVRWEAWGSSTPSLPGPACHACRMWPRTGASCSGPKTRPAHVTGPPAPRSARPRSRGPLPQRQSWLCATLPPASPAWRAPARQGPGRGAPTREPGPS